MGIWQPVTNLKDYVSQNPPGVTFFLCLLTLSISFICLSSYGYTYILPNPDTTKDWNHLLSSLSQLQLCVKINESSSKLVSTVPSHLMEQDNERETYFTKTSVTHLRLKVSLALTSNSATPPLKDFGLHSTLSATQLHIGGNEIVNMSLEFLNGNSSHTCLTISAPTHLLPMNLLPPECPASKKNITFAHVEVINQLPTASQTCYSLHSINDPTLIVMLTKEEQVVAVWHLLEVSMCLLGVCFILCLPHMLIRRYYYNGLDLQNVTDRSP
ncbi:transmembrane protein 248 [Channa argus]|uniref:transmembrane protein 248 n=1 Tax=Channa argus TaxID=215402 RepID=UPI003523071D